MRAPRPPRRALLKTFVYIQDAPRFDRIACGLLYLRAERLADGLGEGDGDGDGGEAPERNHRIGFSRVVIERRTPRVTRRRDSRGSWLPAMRSSRPQAARPVPASLMASRMVSLIVAATSRAISSATTGS